MNKRITFMLLLITVVALVGIPEALALSEFLTDFNTKYNTTNTRLDTCSLCHINPAGGGARNPYGTDFLNNGGNVAVMAALTIIEPLDSDGDGFKNIDEIHNLTFPGNASDFPPVIVSFSPASPVTSTVNGSEVTFAIKVNQPANVTWKLDNITRDQEDTNATNESHFSMTPADAGAGTHSVSAIVQKSGDGTVTQTWSWNITQPAGGAPNITSFSPSTPVMDNVGATRKFNITVDQNVNVTWYINGVQVKNELHVTESNYTNTTAVQGTWNVTAVAHNRNGADMHKWDWIVTTGATFSISGFKINDTNGNGIWDPGELGLDNWNIKLNNIATGAEINTSTDAAGFYQFTNLTNGSYNVTEEMKTGWTPTNATSMVVTIDGQDIVNLNFTNNVSAIPPVTAFSISGFKINDTNGNGIWDPGEMGIENWNIKLNNAATGAEIANTSTDSTGFYRFTNLSNGSYNVTEELRLGMTPTNATSIAVTIAGMDMMNINFTNKPLVSPPIVTSFELIPGKTTELKKIPIRITIRALNVNDLETRFNGMANISILANNANAVTFPQIANFTGGIATIDINSDIAQFVTVTAANGSINGSTKVVFADKVFNLLKGWNLISIPNFADPSGIDKALQLVQNNGVVGFDPATGNFSTPTELMPLFGYWINVTADNQSIGFIASKSIPAVPPSRKLYEGWNLIGVSASRNDSDTLSVGELFVELKFGLDSTQWLYTRLVSFEQPMSPVTFVAGVDLSDVTVLKQGHGYWLSIKSIPSTDKNNVPWTGKQW